MFINYDPLYVGQQLAYYVYLVALFRCHVYCHSMCFTKLMSQMGPFAPKNAMILKPGLGSSEGIQDTSVPGHFGTKTLRYHMTGPEVSGHFGHFGTDKKCCIVSLLPNPFV